MAKRTINLDTKDIELLVKALEQLKPSDAKVAPLVKKLSGQLKTITVSSRKNKGRQLQQDTCKLISELTGIPYDSQVDGLIESRGMGQNGTDISLRGKAQELFPFSVECKNCEQLNLLDAINQAIANKKETTDWLLVHRRKALKNDVVVMDIVAFSKLFSK